MIIGIDNKSVIPVIFEILSRNAGFERDFSGKYFDRAGELVVVALDTANQTDSPVSPSERRAIELLLKSANSTGQRNLDLTQRYLANVSLKNNGSQIDPPNDLVPYDPRSGTPSRPALGPELPAPTPEACRRADARGYRSASPTSIEGGP